MPTMEHDHAVAVLQQFHAYYDVHTRCICCSCRVDDSIKVHCHHTASIVLVTDVAQLSQPAAVCFIDITSRVTQIYDLIHRYADLLVQVVFKIQGANMNALSNIMGLRRVRSRGYLRGGIHFREKCS